MNFFKFSPDSASTNNRDMSLVFPTEPMIARVATTWQDVEALRPVWQSWTTGLHTDLDHFAQSLKSDQSTVGPYVISVWNGATPLGILVAQIKRRKASTTVAMVRVNGPRVRMLEIVTKGRLGPASVEVDRLFATQLALALREGRAELAYFHRLPIGSSLFNSVWNLPGRLMPKRLEHVFSYSEVSLVGTEGTRPAVFSGKIMREARRKTTNLQREFNGRVSFRCFSQPAELSDGLKDVEKVNQGTWQNALGSDFTDPMQTADSFRYFAEKGWLRIFVLYAADRPCAFLIGLLHGKNFHCQHAGYHAEFAKHSVGSVLTNLAFENLASARAERVDLGEGGQEHNRRLRSEKNDEGTVHLYAPTLRGFYLSVFFGMAQASKSLGGWVRTNLHLGWVGMKWRKFLLARKENTPSDKSANRFGKAHPADSFGLATHRPTPGSCD
jgi:CelD/BcsL family acetyltransferase involved in cellulose biosynthesis